VVGIRSSWDYLARVYPRHRRCLWSLGMEFTADSAAGIEDGIALMSMLTVGG
jgi:hypothetical protein